MPSGTALYLLWMVSVLIITNFLFIPLHFVLPKPCCRSVYCTWGFNLLQPQWNISFNLRRIAWVSSTVQSCGGVPAYYLWHGHGQRVRTLLLPITHQQSLRETIPLVFQFLVRSRYVLFNRLNIFLTQFTITIVKTWMDCVRLTVTWGLPLYLLRMIDLYEFPTCTVVLCFSEALLSFSILYWGFN